MAVNSALKLKLDELFLRWLTDKATQNVLRENLMQVKAEQPIETMLSLPSEMVIGPMSASLYGYFYGPSHHESSILNPDGPCNNTSSAFNLSGPITSPRPNTPSYFPQLPFAKLCSPRSPRRHVSASGVLSVQNTKVGYFCTLHDYIG
ncbi:hypothetical protein MN116_006877 [Schistosoma mekongi]|uniref:Uncharacterized protein n=1 Tax=Schistosoma mekongi TaxID=38744 RepID=A0AAE2D2R0_SCHME|nr:hypothetical protein MN116_006877 [Schistosoma mekongi]